MSLFGNHFGKSQVLPLGEVVKTFEGLHNRFKTSTVPSLCRDLIILQYSNDQLGNIVVQVEKVFDHQRNKWKDQPPLNFDDVAAG